MSGLNKRLITAGVFLVLAVGLFLLAKNADILRPKEDEEAAEDSLGLGAPVGDASELFPAAAFDLVTSIQVVNEETGDSFAARNVDGEWVIMEEPEDSDTGLGMDTTRIESAASVLPSITTMRTLNEIESLAPYGLDQTKYTVRFSTAGGSDFVLYIGLTNPTDTAYYAQRPGEDVVHLVSKYNLEDLLSLVDDGPYIQPTPTPEGFEPSPTPEPAEEGEGDQATEGETEDAEPEEEASPTPSA